MRAVYPLYCLSGLVSLGYQVAWFRVFVDRFGSTNLTFGLVLGNFIGGLGVGSLASRRLQNRLERFTGGTHPLRTYGLIEILVAATAGFTLLLPLLPADLWGAFPYDLANGVHRPTFGYEASHVALSVLVVFVPCFFMGATFPLLCRAFQDDTRFPSALYGWNTLGACTGILLCEFLLLPTIGHDVTFAAMAVLNLFLGIYFLRARPATATVVPQSQEASVPHDDSSRPRYTIAATIACAAIGGVLTGAFEADVLRRLQFVNCRSAAALSCISFWAILAIFAASWTVRAVKGLRLVHIKIGYVVAVILYFVLWNSAYELRDWANAADVKALSKSLPQSNNVVHGAPLIHFSYGLGATLKYTGLFVFPTFFLLSLLLPHLCNVVHEKRRHLGIVYGTNTVAFWIGLMAFTSLAPQVNVFYALKLFVYAFPILAVAFIAISPARKLGRAAPIGALLALTVAAFLTPTGFDPDSLTPKSEGTLYPVRAMRSNGTHTTYIVEHPAGDILFFDSHAMSGCNVPSQQYMRLMAHFPLLLHEKPKRALLICFGVGNTAAAIAKHASIEAIDVVDLNDQVIATAPEFVRYNENVTEDERVRLIHDDGRRFLALTDERYELITSEPPPPMFAGMHRLYSTEYYENAKARLTESGLMSQWIPIGQMPRRAVERAISTFVDVFPESVIFVGSDINYIIVGGKRPIDFRTLERRFAAAPAARSDLARYAIRSPHDLLARVTSAGPTLRSQFANQSHISDKGVGFSRIFTTPGDPSVIPYDPGRMLEDIDAANLACHDHLRLTTGDLRRLKYVVPDFPAASLQTAISGTSAASPGAQVNWLDIDRLLELAFGATVADDPAKAIQLLATAARLAPDLPHVVRQVARTQTQLERHDLALNAWRRLHTLIKDDPAAHHESGETFRRLGRRSDAVLMFEAAVKHDRHGIALYSRSLGDAHVALERWGDAKASYEKALGFDPTDALSRAGLESCEAALKRP